MATRPRPLHFTVCGDWSAFLAVFYVCFLEGIFARVFGLVDQGAFSHVKLSWRDFRRGAISVVIGCLRVMFTELVKANLGRRRSNCTPE